MKIYKKLTVDYTTASNEIFRHGLSLKAIGLYLYIVSKPDQWNFSIAGAMQQVADRKEGIHTGLKELEAKGFLTRIQARTGGKFAQNEWNITDKPLTEKPPAEKPLTEKPPQVIPNIVKTNKDLVKTRVPRDGVVVVGGDVKVRNFANSEVTDAVEYLKQRLGLPSLDDTIARNRQYAWSSIRKFGGLPKVKLVIDAVAGNQFWKNKVTSMKQIYYNGVKFISETRPSGGKVYDATAEGL